MNQIGNITEGMLEQICLKVVLGNGSERNEQLREVFLDIEFWEGGSVQIEDEDTIWLSGDNGRSQQSLSLILGVKSIVNHK